VSPVVTPFLLPTADVADNDRKITKWRYSLFLTLTMRYLLRIKQVMANIRDGDNATPSSIGTK
ncbi:hypothetical protein, partial [Proteus mirabilis]|uniref:hypothetical protein n=1 Tax=Proteus mirabilis TaxID=584 RepID=UPI0025549A59